MQYVQKIPDMVLFMSPLMSKEFFYMLFYFYIEHHSLSNTRNLES